MLANLERRWHEPDEGIWEVRGPRRHFTHSKVMAWVAFDRGVKAVEEYGRERRRRPLAPRSVTRSTREVLERGYDEELGSFVGTTTGSDSTRAC
jgi:GH15 family glucan-1,4-alpha-glucosidase